MFYLTRMVFAGWCSETDGAAARISDSALTAMYPVPMMMLKMIQ